MGETCSKSTFKIENNTYQDITNTQLSSIDNYDWHGNSRPDHNFAWARIPAGSWKEETEDMNGYASDCPFTMTLTFTDGTQDQFRIHQKYAYGSDSNFWAKSSYRQYNHNRNEGNHSVWVTITDNPDVVQRNKAQTYFLKGKTFWDEGWTLEKSKGLANEESKIKFGEAKHEFENSKNEKNDAQYEKYLSLVWIKIEGNSVVESAYLQEASANELCSEAAAIQSISVKKQEAIELYMDSLNEFRNAAINYSAADKIFNNGLMLGENLFKESIHQIENITAKIDEKMQLIKDNINNSL